jgi:hypothetical protein
MKKQKAYYTVYYTKGKTKAQMTSRGTKSDPGEVLFAFHKFMQNTKGINDDEYHVEEFHKGNERSGLVRYDEFMNKPTPQIPMYVGGTTLFEQ